VATEESCKYEGCGHRRSDHVTKRVLGGPSRLLDQYGKREVEEITECVVCKRDHIPGTIATGWFTHSYRE
jgi:hypothetical protein